MNRKPPQMLTLAPAGMVTLDQILILPLDMQRQLATQARETELSEARRELSLLVQDLKLAS